MSVALSIACSFALAALPPAQDCEISSERVERLGADARKAVEKVLSVELELPLRLASREEAAAIVARENEPILRAQGVAPPDLEHAARAVGEAYGTFMLAKYAWSTGEMLVVAENFAEHARTLERPELCSDDALRAILVHELVHAADHRQFAFDDVLATLATTDRIQAYNAVIEGHAQYVARSICAGEGWTGGFEAFTSSIGQLVDADAHGAAVALLLETVSATIVASYVQGESFVAAIERAGGADAVARAFREPPSDMEVLYHPEWFLDPSKRPAPAFDADAALALARERFPESDWIHVSVVATHEQLRLATSMIPPSDTERMLAGLVNNRVLVFTSKSPPGAAQVHVALFEFRSPEAATVFMAGEERVLRAKDETMKEGAIRIDSAEYTSITSPSVAGVLARKQLRVGPQELEVVTVCASRKRLGVETTFSGEPVSDEDLVAFAEGLLRRAAREDAPPGGGVQLTFDDLDLGAVPAGWEALVTSEDATPNAWGVRDEASAPSGARVLALTTDNSGSTYNLLLSPESHPADLDLSVALRADRGDEDRGGGLVWRASGTSSYYLVRWNPLEENVRAYIVQEGERRMLASADAKTDPGAWHRLTVRARGSQIEIEFDGERVLAVEDAAIASGGRVGLWTKADASTAFDDVTIKPAR